MQIQNTIFYKDEWRWSKFQKYLMSSLNKYTCKEYKIPSEYTYKESTYGSKKDKKNVVLSTWAVHNERINFCRSVCISSPSYSVLNFLIIPNTLYNVPFFGVDFVSLPNYHLIVMDFQPSINVNIQFEKVLLNKLLSLKDEFHKKVPLAEKMSRQIEEFFSPGVVWSKLPKEELSDDLIQNTLYPSYEKYLNLYLKVLFSAKVITKELQSQIVKGQNNYLDYRKRNDPAKPMLKVLFGESFTDALIKNLLFKAK